MTDTPNNLTCNQRLLKTAVLRFSGGPIRTAARTYKKGVSDMFDLDSTKKGWSGLGDKAIGSFAIGAPAATAAYSVNQANKKNSGLSKSKRTQENVTAGAQAGLVDGSTAALLHRSKNSLGRGGAGLLKRMAIYGGTSAAIGSGIGGALSMASSSTKEKSTKKPGK